MTPENCLGQIVSLKQPLGKGAEHYCYEEATLPPNQRKVIKIPNWFGRIWQTQGIDFAQRCIEALDRLRIRRIEMEVMENVTAVYPNGNVRKHRTIFKTPYIEGVDDKSVKYGDLVNPETGKAVIHQLIELIHASNRLHDEELGLDIYGGTIITDTIKGIFQRVVLALTFWKTQDRIGAVRGRISNVIIKENGEVLLTDPHMHDFSAQGKLKYLTRLANHLTYESLIIILKHANTQLPEEKRIPEEKFEELTSKAGRIEKQLAAILFKIMRPIFELAEKQAKKST